MKTKAIPSIVTMIVGRCHVGESNRAVIRYFVSRLKRGAWQKLSRARAQNLAALGDCGARRKPRAVPRGDDREILNRRISPQSILTK